MKNKEARESFILNVSLLEMDGLVTFTSCSSNNVSILSLGALPSLPVLSCSEDSTLSKVEMRDESLFMALSLNSKKQDDRGRDVVENKKCKCFIM